jgi:hypothetical protein
MPVRQCRLGYPMPEVEWIGGVVRLNDQRSRCKRRSGTSLGAGLNHEEDGGKEAEVKLCYTERLGEET